MKQQYPPSHPLWAQKAAGDEEARHTLIEAHRWLIGKTRQRIIPSCPVKIEPAELESEGCIALIRAVDQFDPSRGVLFTSYAISFIRGAMLEFLRKEDWTPRSVRTKQKTLKRAEEMCGWDASPEELAAFLGLDRDKFAALQAEAQDRQVCSLDDVIDDSEHDDLDPLVVGEGAADPRPGPESLALAGIEAEQVRRMIGWLPKPEERVIRLYYFEGLTLKKIAREIGRSESRAHQIHAQAIKRFCDFMGVPPPASTRRGFGALRPSWKWSSQFGLSEKLGLTVWRAAQRLELDLSQPLRKEQVELLAKRARYKFGVVRQALADIRRLEGFTVRRSRPQGNKKSVSPEMLARVECTLLEMKVSLSAPVRRPVRESLCDELQIADSTLRAAITHLAMREQGAAHASV
jgi:RNA polymerase sigma factor FliA